MFAFSTNRPVSAERMTVLPQRLLRRIVMLTALIAASAGLAVGMMAGHYLVPRTIISAAQADQALQLHVIGELGKLSVSLNQIAPRVQRLSAEADKLRDFEERLHVRPIRPSHPLPDQALSLDAEGGPEQAPRPCIAESHTARALAGQISCMQEILDVLESELGRHETAWARYPGRFPVTAARFGSPFGNRIDPFTHHLAFHPGIDLVAPIGTFILATAAGRVSFAGWKPGYGNVVEIDHGRGFTTRYGHASRLLVYPGQRVLAGDRIAEVGSTGRSTGPHLHFEVLRDGLQTNPAEYLALFSGLSHD
ncbi:M23 family metallopeptidase [Burkholderia sp. JSH-S8]|nr:M23 family metallopeptidase [Burkholderia sp. JSH-S8]